MLSTPILHSILKHSITTIHLQTTTHNDIYLEDLSSRPNVARRTTAAALLSTSTERDMGGTTFTDLGAREGNNGLGNRPGSTGSALWQLACRCLELSDGANGARGSGTLFCAEIPHLFCSALFCCASLLSIQKPIQTIIMHGITSHRAYMAAIDDRHACLSRRQTLTPSPTPRPG